VVDESGTVENDRQPPTRSRLPIVVTAVVIAFVLIGGGALVAVGLSTFGGADPAERLPASAVFYVDINLRPGDESTVVLSDLLDGFGPDGFSAHLERDLDNLLDLLGVEDVEPGDVTRWIGTRGAVAIYNDRGSGDDDVLALAIASRNDRLARQTLAAIWNASSEEFGYVVDDGIVVLAIAGRDPQQRADEIVAAGRLASMAEHEPFRAGLERLGGDRYFATGWVDIAADGIAVDSDLAIPPGVDFLDVRTILGADSIVFGAQVIHGGLEVSFTTGERDGGFGQSDWLARLREVDAAQAALMVTLPDDLGQFRDDLIEFVDNTYNAPLPLLDEYERGRWDYDLALSDDELDEYNDLNRRLAVGTLGEDDPDFDRLVELDDAYWKFGLQSDWDHAAEMGWTMSHMSIKALSRDEYYELLRIDAERGTPSVTDADEDWYFKAIRRLYAFGLESDYEGYEPDVNNDEVADLLLDYLSGLRITATVGDVLDESQLGLAAEVADGRADRLHQLPRPVLHDLFDLLETAPRFEDSRVVFSELDGADGTLAEHPRFADAFAGMPTEAVLVLFVDVQSINDSQSGPEPDVDDFSVISMVYGTDGIGMLRVLID
jgi:hypothetical protein